MESSHAQPKRIVIVGGVAGGASAAARARRLDERASIVLFERGREISFANCGMPYHVGGAIGQRDRLLVQTPKGMHRRYRIDVRTRHEVTRIDRDRRRVIARNLDTGQTVEEPYDALILSPGAEPVRPPIPGLDSPGVFTLRSLADMDAIKRVVDSDRPGRAVVIGGGYIGLEMTEAFRERGLDVTLVELAGQVFSAADAEMAAPLHQHLRLHGVDLRLRTSVEAIEPGGDGLRVRLSDGREVQAGLVMLAIGVRPESGLAREAGLEVGPSGGIVTDAHMRTSDPAIYAVGDAVEVSHLVGGHRALIPLAGPANRQGRVAADNIFGRSSVYRQTQGTAICKVFDLAIGMTGLSETQLRRLDRPYEKIYIHPASHAGYYPGATQMSLKLLFDPREGTLLGAQAIGAGGVDKRIDVLAVALRAGLTVHDLKDLELSYAPPFGSAKDPVNYAGFVASNVLAGDEVLIHAADVGNLGDDQILLDVRTPAEVQTGTIPGALNIPLDELRDRLDELPADKEVLAFCQVGLRGYLACRILNQHGRRSRNLSGGYRTWQAVTESLDAPAAPAELTNDTGAEAPMEPADESTECCRPDATAPGGCCGPKEAGPGCCSESHAGVGSLGASQAGTATLTAPARTAVSAKPAITHEIDARGLQCPGPILRLKTALDALEAGQAVAIVAGDPGFPADVRAWCHSTGQELVEVRPVDGACRAVIRKRGSAPSPAEQAAPADAIGPKGKTIVVFSGDFDKAVASFIIANGAAAMGSGVTMFFTFWGLNVLRRAEGAKVAKSPIERMFGWMMPRGADRLALSKMHMGGMGLRMIKGIMRRKNVASLPELIASAQAHGVRLVACSMSMDLMGIRREELIDGVTEGGVATYLDTAESGNVNLFI